MSLRSPFYLIRNLFAALLHVWHRCLYIVARWLRKDTATYVTLELQQEYPFGPAKGIARYFQQDISWMELRELLDSIKESPEIDGLIVETDALQLGMGRASSIRDMIDEVRTSGTHVVAFMEGATTAEYMLATAADDILMPPVESMFTFGPRFDQTFAKDVLDKWDIEPQFIHLGDFKTATHTAIHDSMTVPQQSMMGQLHRRLVDGLTERVATRRNLDPEAAGDRLFGEAPQEARQAIQHGLVDHGVFFDRLQPWLMRGDEIPAIARHDDGHLIDEEAADDDTDADPLVARENAPAPTGSTGIEFLDLEDASAVMKPEYEWWRLVSSAPTIAVLNLSGPIVDDADQLPIQQSSVIEPDEVIPAVQQLRDDPDVAGVIAHINSPGGSATASDVIWQALADLGDTKPLVAYCTDVAASGGYYLASAANRIVCHDTTMTGSIGVVLGKVSAPDLPGRLGINIESIHTYESDTFTSLTHSMGDDLMDRLNDQGRSFYRRFLERVGQARELSRRRLHRYARGRVYFGQDAQQRSLVDQVGGFEDAFDWVRQQTDLQQDEPELVYVEHRHRGIGDVAGFPGLTSGGLGGAINRWLDDDVSLSSSIVEHLTAAPDDTPGHLSPELTAAMLQREHLLAVAPMRLDWPS
jgi:protease-4